MANFPSKWYDFVTAKEIKRIRRDINDKRMQLIQMLMALFTAIFTPVYSQFLEKLEIWESALIWAAYCIYFAIVFFLPQIVRACRKLFVSNILVNNKEALTKFDEEVVYSTLVACEFSEFNTSTMSPELAIGVDTFNNIEVEYYVKNAITILTSFTTRVSGIFGNNTNQISKERCKNITDILDALIRKHNIQLEDMINNQYVSLKNAINE